MTITPEDMKAIASLKHSLGGQALLKLAAEKTESWTIKLIHADSDDVAENARLRAKIFAYKRLQDFLNAPEVEDG